MTLDEAKKIIKSECYIADLLNLDRTQMVNTALDMAIMAILALEETRWIPVSEKLPDTEEDVSATDGVDIFVAYYYIDKWGSFDRSYNEYNNPVTAWMPLPQPYKAEGSDEE